MPPKDADGMANSVDHDQKELSDFGLSTGKQIRLGGLGLPCLPVDRPKEQSSQCLFCLNRLTCPYTKIFYRSWRGAWA